MALQPSPSSNAPARAYALLDAVPDGVKVVAYGGGVNTIAGLVRMRRLGVTPRAILQADPGAEWNDTIAYREKVANPYLDSIGFPRVVVVSRMEELRYRKNGVNFETLRGLCERTASLPSVAYPPSNRCSQNYKAAPQRWWLDRQEWAQAEWAAGRKLVRCLGYDRDEPKRIKDGFGNDDEDAKAVPWYHVYDAGLDRAGCVALIKSEGLPVPRKSACKFCPNNDLQDWHDLYWTDRAAFDDAVEMSRAADATIESPKVVGLLRGFAPQGKRALHVWVDGGYGDSIGPVPGTVPNLERDEDEWRDGDEMPCECHE